MFRVKVCARACMCVCVQRTKQYKSRRRTRFPSSPCSCNTVQWNLRRKDPIIVIFKMFTVLAIAARPYFISQLICVAEEWPLFVCPPDSHVTSKPPLVRYDKINTKLCFFFILYIYIYRLLGVAQDCQQKGCSDVVLRKNCLVYKRNAFKID